MNVLKNIAMAICLFSFLYPCSCEELPPPEEAYEISDVVFSGQVTQIVENWYDGFMEISIEVFDVWKGTIDNQIILLSGLDDCGYYFQLNEEYLIYGYYSQLNHIWTDICTRTNLLEDAEEDLDYLNNLSNTQTYIFNENIRITQSSNDRFAIYKLITITMVHSPYLLESPSSRNTYNHGDQERIRMGNRAPEADTHAIIHRVLVRGKNRPFHPRSNNDGPSAQLLHPRPERHLPLGAQSTPPPPQGLRRLL